jgi:uncharacterized protein (TIGR00730 family)
MTSPDNSRQKASPSYRLASLDQDFLLGDSMRGVRFLLEYAKAEDMLRRWGVRSTIVVFGSARARPPGVPGPLGDAGARWYEAARAFGTLASLEGGAVDRHEGEHDNVIATGGGPGIMEAANRGALEAGAPTIGFNITLPHEQDPNAYSTPDLTFRFHYFAMRKMHLAMRANALVIFPGGFGTMDEMFEVLTLRQTGKVGPLPIVLFDRAYWKRIVDFGAFVETGMVEARDLELFSYADGPDQAWRCLLDRGLRIPGPFRPPAPPAGEPAGA